jgi:hypothetical protein
MDRRKFFHDQVVDQGDLDGLQDAIEAAIGRVLSDFFFGTKAQAVQWGTPGSLNPRDAGVIDGLDVTVGFGLSVTVSAGVAYDAGSRRLALPAAVTLDCSRDALGAPTRPSTGLSREIGVTIRQARNEYDRRPQADGATASYRSDESALIEAWQSADYDRARGQAPGPLTLPEDGLARVLLATFSIDATTAQIDSARLRLVTQQRPPVGQFGVEGDLPLAVKDALCLIAAKTFGNLEVVPLRSVGPNTTVFVNHGWAAFSTGTVRSGGVFLQLTPPASGERTMTRIFLRLDGTVGQARAASTQGTPAPPAVPGTVPLAVVRWDWNGLYGVNGFSPFDVADERPFLCRPGGALVTRFRTSIVAALNQTVFDLTLGSAGADVRYVPGNGSLSVFWATAGAPALFGLLGESEYVETNPTRVTLTSPARAGDVYRFEVLLIDGQ